MAKGVVVRALTRAYFCAVRDIPDACANNPCLNGATCIADPDDASRYSCYCAAGFSGTTCEGEHVTVTWVWEALGSYEPRWLVKKERHNHSRFKSIVRYMRERWVLSCSTAIEKRRTFVRTISAGPPFNPPVTLKFKKYILPTLLKRSVLVRISSTISFHLNKRE